MTDGCVTEKAAVGMVSRRFNGPDRGYGATPEELVRVREWEITCVLCISTPVAIFRARVVHETTLDRVFGSLLRSGW